MRVLGIDCGVERTGYGVIESDGRTHRLLVAGVVRTSPRDPLEARLLQIAQGLREAIRLHAPVSAAVGAGLSRRQREDCFEAGACQGSRPIDRCRGGPRDG